MAIKIDKKITGYNVVKPEDKVTDAAGSAKQATPAAPDIGPGGIRPPET